MSLALFDSLSGKTISNSTTISPLFAGCLGIGSPCPAIRCIVFGFVTSVSLSGIFRPSSVGIWTVVPTSACKKQREHDKFWVLKETYITNAFHDSDSTGQPKSEPGMPSGQLYLIGIKMLRYSKGYIRLDIFYVLRWQLSTSQVKCTYNANSSTYILYGLLIKMRYIWGPDS